MAVKGLGWAREPSDQLEGSRWNSELLVCELGPAFDHNHQRFEPAAVVADHGAPALLAPDQAEFRNPGPGANAIGSQAPMALWSDLHFSRWFVKFHAAHLAAEPVGEGSLDGAVLIGHAQVALKSLEFSACAIEANEATLPLTSVMPKQDVPSGEWGVHGE